MKLEELKILLKEDVPDDSIILTNKEAHYIVRKEDGAKFTSLKVRSNYKDVNVAALFVPIEQDEFKQKYNVSENREHVELEDPLTGNVIKYKIPSPEEWGGANYNDARFFLFLPKGQHPDEIKAREKLEGGA